ncbi:hypothetical protein BC832DRAFT_170625 [Gaertneriomyces semiglobifer]|nr:hypothetical protein BC832DRAFT_170625 [Gaertneriomyces semiglobifer]
MLAGGTCTVDRQVEASRLFDALSACKERAKATPEALHGFRRGHVCIWFVPSAVLHPLRDVHGASPFFLATTVEVSDPVEIEVQAPLSRTRCVDVGTLQADMVSLLGGLNVERDLTHHEWSIPSTQSDPVPIPLDEARYLLSLYCEAAFHCDPATTLRLEPLYCLTTLPAEPGEIVKAYLGSGARIVGSGYAPIIYTVERGEWVAREEEDGGIEQTARHKAPPTLTDIFEDCNDVLNVDNASDYCLRVYAKYDILSESLFKLKPNAAGNSIVMEVSWKGCQSTLSSPPPSAQAILRIRSVCGEHDPENHLATASLRKELMKLVEWDQIRQRDCWPPETEQSQGLAADRVDDWVRGTITLHWSFFFVCIIDHFTIQILTEAIKDEGFNMTEQQSLPASNSSMSSVTFDLDASTTLPERQDLDFAERFWKFTSGLATSQADLLLSLTTVIEELETGRLQPLVNKYNPSSFARTIRDLYRLSRMQTASDADDLKESISRTMDYWLEQPLEVLVEIGIWKLKRDYCFWLVGSGVVRWDELDAFIDATLPLTHQVQRLLKLHRVMELFHLMKSNLVSLPFESLRTLIGVAMHTYLESEEPATDDLVADDAGAMETLMYRFVLPRWGESVKVVEGFEPRQWSVCVVPDPNTTDRIGRHRRLGAPRRHEEEEGMFMMCLYRHDEMFASRMGAQWDMKLQEEDMETESEQLERVTDTLLAGTTGCRYRVVRASARYM